MDDSGFDAWTRRNVGVAVGGIAGSLWALAKLDFAEAKKKKKKKKKRCLRLNATCNPNAGKKCCGDRACAPPLGSTTTARCCNPPGTPCSVGTQSNCCSGVCNTDTSSCFCKPTGGACSANSHCCSNNCNFTNNTCI